MTNLKVSELHLLKSDLKKQYKVYRNAFIHKIQHGSLPSKQELHRLLRHGPAILRKLKHLCEHISQTELDRSLNSQELHRLLNIVLLDETRPPGTLSFLRSETPLEWKFALSISEMFGIDDAKLFFIQNAIQNRIENPLAGSPRDQQLRELGPVVTAQAVQGILDALENKALLTTDNCKKIFSNLRHLDLRKEALQFFSENKIEITQRKLELICEMNRESYQDTKKILSVAEEWKLKSTPFLNKIVTSLLQLESSGIKHVIFCLERMGKHTFLRTEDNFHYAISFRSPNGLGNAVMQLELKKKFKSEKYKKIYL